MHIRRGPNDKINEAASTLIEAIRIADRITGETGKRAMVYALTEAGESVFIPKAVIDEVRRGSADARLPTVTIAAQAARQPGRRRPLLPP